MYNKTFSDILWLNLQVVKIYLQSIFNFAAINHLIDSTSSTEDELFTCYSLLVTFYSLILTFYSLLLPFYSLLIPFYSLLITNYSLLVTFYSFPVTTYSLLCTFHSSLVIRYSVFFSRYFSSLISTIYLLNFGKETECC